MDAPVKAREQLPRVVRFDPKEIMRAVREVEGFNAKLALIITRSVGTMACAYLFSLLALVSLPAILIQAGVLTKSDVPTFFTKPGLILIVAWIAQTFLQLVLLSIILVGQSVQSAASDVRSAKEFASTSTPRAASKTCLTRSMRSAPRPQRRKHTRPRQPNRVDHGGGFA
jgi:hypothetical protein